MSGFKFDGNRISVCIVTNELYPLSAGGIGRLMYNFARQNAELGFPIDLHFLVPPNTLKTNEEKEQILNAFGENVTIHICPRNGDNPFVINQLMERAAQHKWTFESHYALTYQYYNGLLEAQKKAGKEFDIIEFPDFGGWALATIEAKRAGLNFQKSEISVRLHSTQGIIYRNDRFAHHPSLWLGVLFDSERHLLEYADVVVGHVRGIVSFNAEHYGLEKKWRGKIVQEFPPILLDESVRTARAISTVHEIRENEFGTTLNGISDPDFVFSSRFQQFKRPDLFIRGAVIFLEKNHNYVGSFRLISYGWDTDYIEWLRSLVPPYLKHKIVFHFNTDPDVREEFIRTSIVVIPSDYESLCLFAFEAGTMGCKVILNGECLAFSTSERWRDGRNCLFFDGSAEDLASTMEKAITWSPISSVNTLPDVPYWTGTRLQSSSERCQASELPSVSLVCFGYRSVDEIRSHFGHLAHLDLKDVHVIFLPSRDVVLWDKTLEEYALKRGWFWEVMPGIGDDPFSFSKRMLSLRTELLAFLPTGYKISVDFLEKARASLFRNENVSLVGGHVRVTDEFSGTSESIRAYAGHMPSLALLSSRIAPATSVFRTRLLEDFPFDTRAMDMWFSVWLRDIALSGVEMLILPEIVSDLSSAMERRENTKNISGGILDKFFRDNGLRPRGIVIDPVSPIEKSEPTTIKIVGDDFRRCTDITPRNHFNSSLISRYDHEKSGIILHPKYECASIVSMPYHGKRLRRIEAIFRNDSTHNNGLDCAVALMRPDALPIEIQDMVNFEKSGWVGTRSNWIRVLPGETITVPLAVSSSSYGGDQILFLSRRLTDGVEGRCFLTITHLELHIMENSV